MSHLRGAGVTPAFNGSSLSNATNISNSTSCDPTDTSAHLVFMLFYGLVFLVGLVLNGFTLKVYFCRSQQQTSSSVTVYLKNLAAADFFISLCLPLRITNLASSSAHIQRAYCNFSASAFYLNMYASILFMGYIAANRYLKIVHPLGTHVLQTVRAAHIVSMVTWVFLFTTMTTYVLLSVLTQPGVPDSIEKAQSCDVLHSKQLHLLYKTIHTTCAVIFLLVLASLVFFYHSTSRRLSQAQRRKPASSSSRKLAKARRNMLVLVSVFCVCFVPYHLVRVPYAFQSSWSCSGSHAFFYLKEVATMLSVLNICLDPLIYFIFCKAFRAQLGLRSAFTTTQVPTNAADAGGHSSDRRLSDIRVLRKASLEHTKQPSVLQI